MSKNHADQVIFHGIAKDFYHGIQAVSKIFVGLRETKNAVSFFFFFCMEQVDTSS